MNERELETAEYWQARAGDLERRVVELQNALDEARLVARMHFRGNLRRMRDMGYRDAGNLRRRAIEQYPWLGDGDE